MKKKLIVASILGIAGTAGVMETNVFAQNISSDEEIEEAWENQNEELSTTNPYITERENPPIIEKTDLVTADENKSEVKEDSFESGFKEIISDDEVFYDNKITDKDGFMDFSLDQTVISIDKTSEDKLESLPITESKIEGNNAVEIENSTSVEEDSFNVSDISKLVKTAKYVSNIQNGWNANQTSYYIDGKLTYGQKQIDGHWYYFDHNGNKAANCFINLTIQNGWNANQTSYYIDGKLTYGQKQIDGHWYYFDHNGNKAANCFINLTAQENKEGAKTVYYNGKGQMLYGQQKLNNDWYCFNLFDGRMLTGLTYLSKGYEPSGAKTVYYDPASGKMQYGEVKVNGNWMYFDTVTGAQAKNKQITVKNSVSNNKKTSTYYYKDDGHKATGEMQIQSKWKCFDIKTGAMKTGFVKLTKKDYKTNRDKTVYYDGNGNMVYGQKKIGNDWYCFDLGDGKMFTGKLTKKDYKTNRDKTVYYDGNGNMVYGQKKIGNDWYCFDLGDGKMFTGLTYLSQKYERNGAKTVYYDPASGKMLYGTIERDGKVYTFSLYDGAQQNGTLRNETINGKKGLIFYGKDGLKKTGQQQFNGKWYFFNSKNNGFAQTGLYTLSKEEEKSGSKTVYYNSDGTMFYGEKKLEGKWKWFKPVTGAMAKNEFINLPAKKNEASKTCYYDQNGNMLYGNQKINNLNYHFHNVTGAWDNQADVKIEELCNKIYNQVGRDIHKLYEWTWNNIQYQTLPIHVTPPNGYTREQNYALKGLSEKKGNCYVYAATFAALARNLGYNIRYVEGYVRTNTGGLSNHGWTEITINGATYICDPEAELDFPANISFYMQPINSPKLPYVKK